MAYFKIYLDRDDEVVIIQLGECDEIDYNQKRFLSTTKFDTEDEAITYLQENTNKLPSHVYNPYANDYLGILD